jgi:hypothetical protein
MPKTQRIAAKWADGTRAELEEFTAHSRLPGAVLSLFKTTDDDAGSRWSYSVLTPERVHALAAVMAARGHSLLYSLDGVTVAISNVAHAKELEGAVLTVDGPGYLTVRTQPTAR